MKKFTMIIVFLFTAFSWVAAQGNVTFNLDTTGGGFAAADRVFISGAAWGWPAPGDNAALEMFDNDADGIFSVTLPMCERFYEFKFFKNTGWDNGEPISSDRVHVFTGEDENLSFTWGDRPADVAVNNLLPVTFENATDNSWATFSLGPDPVDCSEFAIVPNPSASGINTSANALKFVVHDNADQWAGAWTSAYDTIKFTEEYHTLTMMVYKSVIGRTALKVENSSNGGPILELFATNTKTDEWELLTYNFKNAIGYEYPRFVIFPDFPAAARTAGATVYLDNIAEAVQTEYPYPQLYVIGDACPVGWDLPNAIPMKVDGTDANIFTWKGPLIASEIKFATQNVAWDQGDEITALTNGADAATATDFQIRACGGGSCTGDDNKWMVDAAGIYLITIDVELGTIAFELQGQYQQLYVIGDACPVGWDLPNAIPMVVDGTDPTIFTWEGPLIASEIKFATQNVAWDQGDEITALTNGADAATATTYQIRPCANGNSYGDDNKWMVENAGTYLITINLTAKTIAFEQTTGIKEVDAFSNVSVYPNPASDMLNVNVGQNTGASISLFSIDGRRFYSQVATESTTSIDMRKMKASGIVIVKVENDQLSKVFRVVVK